MDTQPSSAHLASLARCFLSSATKAADPAVTLTSGKMLETSGDVTVKSKAAGLPSIKFVARTSAGHLRRSSDPYLPPTFTWTPMQALRHDSTKTSRSLLWQVTTSPPCLQVTAWWVTHGIQRMSWAVWAPVDLGDTDAKPPLYGCLEFQRL